MTSEQFCTLLWYAFSLHNINDVTWTHVDCGQDEALVLRGNPGTLCPMCRALSQGAAHVMNPQQILLSVRNPTMPL